jgi:hypothetical protein
MSSLLSSIDVSQLLRWMGVLSVLTFAGSLLAVPWLILQLPENYFIRHRLETGQKRKRHPMLSVLLFCFRNSLGTVLFVCGIAMLVLPGQGLLTMVIGLALMDFPGKHQLLELLVSNRGVQRSLNWIRRKGDRKELVFYVSAEED